MHTHRRGWSLLALPIALLAARAWALDGVLSCHDPSTVIACDGKYYMYYTGDGIPGLTSDDGFTWKRGTPILASLGGRIPETVHALSPANNGVGVWAPDIIKINDQYYLYYAVSAWMDFRSVVGLMTSPTLDPQSPNYKWTDRGPIVWSNGTDTMNDIDPGVMLDPTNGSLWMVFGSYHGTIQLVELDPKTGLRKDKSVPTTTVASQSEASDLMYHDGWYYLLTNHGSCCNGATSTYNIRVGRAKKVTGPYLDSWSVDMARGGGNLFLAAGEGHIGPGHFGLLEVDGVQKFSCHYEADTTHAGSILDIRPLLWKDGWPVAGNDPKEGVYQVLSKRGGTIIELAIPGVPATPGRGRQGAASAGGRGAGAGVPPTDPAQPAAQPVPSAATSVNVQLAASLIQAQQKWTLTTAGGGYYRFTHATGRALALTDAGTLTAAPIAKTPVASNPAEAAAFNQQLWKIDQLSDGSYRIKPKTKNLALTAGLRNQLGLQEFKADDDNQKWLLPTP